MQNYEFTVRSNILRWIWNPMDFSINSYSAGTQQAWQRGDTGNVNPLSRLERPARMRPAASRQIFIAQNFACTSLTCQCVYVKIFRLENPKRKARFRRISAGTPFSSLALMSFAWAPRSVSFFGYYPNFGSFLKDPGILRTLAYSWVFQVHLGLLKIHLGVKWISYQLSLGIGAHESPPCAWWIRAIFPSKFN